MKYKAKIVINPVFK